MALPIDGLARDGLKAIGAAVRRTLDRQADPAATDAAKTLGRDAFKASDYPFIDPHSKSAWAHVHAVGGTQQVTQLPAVSPRATKLGVFGVFDNNLSQGGHVMAQRFARLGKMPEAGLVFQSTDPVDQATLRILDDAGKMPYQKLGDVSGSDPAQLQNFVSQHLFGSTGGASSGPKDLVLADHGGAIWGWGQTRQGVTMGWPDAMNAIKAGMPAGQKLRALVTDMCMTGGSAEAAVEASSKGVAHVMIGSEDESISEGFREDKLLAALDRNPQMNVKAIAKEVLSASKPSSVNTRDYQVVATSLDPRKVAPFTSAFKNLSDLLVSKGQSDPAIRQGLRQALTAARSPSEEVQSGDGNFFNRDVKLLMQDLRTRIPDPQIQAATRAVDKAHDGMVIAHQENKTEHRAATGLSVNTLASFDAPMNLFGRTVSYGDYYKQTAFDQATGWSGVLDMAHRDVAALQQALQADKAGNTPQAIALLRQAVAENPSNLDAQAWLGSLLGKDPKTASEAVTVLKGVARHQDFGTLELATTKRLLGEAYLTLGDKTHAITELTRMKNNLDTYLATAQNTQSYNQFLQTQQTVAQDYGAALKTLESAKTGRQ